MYLIAIAWMYVALMMSLAEGFSPNGTWLGAFFTLLKCRQIRPASCSRIPASRRQP